MKSLLLLSAALGLSLTACRNSTDRQTAQQTTASPDSTGTDWAMLPFEKVDSLNPVLVPSPALTFRDPIWKKDVKWEEKDVFNPAAVVRDGKVYLVYRAEDKLGKYAGVSRLGLAISTDGLHFEKEDKPIFFPDNDAQKKYEWEGGSEDPRIVESPQGDYVMTYTAYDGKTARMMLATSPDLRKWTKHGPVLGEGKHLKTWSKSGAIVAKQKGDQIVAEKINGKYWMYFGDTNLFLAQSDDLIHWTPLEEADGSLKPIVRPRPGKFDGQLVEPGPYALLTEKGILLIYNSARPIPDKKDALVYSAGQVLLDKQEPTKILARTSEPFFIPEKNYELTGQVNNVVFLEGLVPFKNKWFLYYGTADSKIAVAVHEN
ncbi:glycoside hydrolase family 130 protein [Siphonobacter sp.]|uniref:glycoside hydrolase family 130 protein n=1 Tax=Siphonobacter sp. TaxID=1869184 RepID=UPI003B3B3479